MNKTIVYHRAEPLLDPSRGWNQLAGGVPFRRTEWVRSWWEHFGRHQDTVFLAVEDDQDRVRGILPLVRNGARCYESIAGGTICSDHLSLLSAAHDLPEVAASLADFLIQQSSTSSPSGKPFIWDRLRFDGVVAGDPGMQILLQELQNRSAALRMKSRLNLWYLPCHRGWDDFLTTSPRRSRQRYQSTLRKLEHDQNTLEVRIVDNEIDVENCIRELIRLHQKHWTALGEPGSFANPAMTPFVLDAAIQSFRQNRLFLPTMIWTDPETHSEKIIATQLYFVGDDRRLYCYTTAVDYDYAEMSPGILLNAFLVRHCHQANYSGIDFMRGDEEYKRRLGANAVPVMQADVYAPTPRGRAMTVMQDFCFGFKQAVRKHRGRPIVQTPTLSEAFCSSYQDFLPQPIDASYFEGVEDPKHPGAKSGNPEPIVVPMSDSQVGSSVGIG